MEELHKIHKDVPFGYWVLWVAPGWRAFIRWLRAADVPGSSGAQARWP